MGFEDSFREDIFEEMFDEFDKDGSGEIEKVELKALIAGMLPGGGNEAAAGSNKKAKGKSAKKKQ